MKSRGIIRRCLSVALVKHFPTTLPIEHPTVKHWTFPVRCKFDGRTQIGLRTELERLSDDLLFCIALALSRKDSYPIEKWEAARSLIYLRNACRRLAKMYADSSYAWRALWERDLSAVRPYKTPEKYAEAFAKMTSVRASANLAVACRKGWERAAEYFLRRGGRLTAEMVQQSLGKDPAICERWLDALELSHGLVRSVVERGSFQQLERIWPRYVAALDPDGEKKERLLEAAIREERDIRTARWLMERGCSLSKEKKDRLLYHGLATEPFVRLLLEQGADMYANEAWRSAFGPAKSAFLEFGFDVHWKEDELLVRACTDHSMGDLRRLLDAGADPRARQDRPLALVCRGHMGPAALLLLFGAVPTDEIRAEANVEVRKAISWLFDPPSGQSTAGDYVSWLEWAQIVGGTVPRRFAFAYFERYVAVGPVELAERILEAAVACPDPSEGDRMRLSDCRRKLARLRRGLEF